MQTRKLRRGEIYKVKCSEFVSDGYGLSHIETENLLHQVKPLTGFILGMLPGENGFVKVIRVKSGHFFGVLLTINELKESKENIKYENQSAALEETFVHKKWALMSVSSDRVEEPCEKFVFCGGCKLLHLSYEKTLEYKNKWLLSQFQREKVISPEAEIIYSPQKFHYRNHVQVHINKYKERGFYAPASYRTTPFPEEGCLIFEQKFFDKDFPEELELERCVRYRFDYVTEKTGIWSLNSPEDKKAEFTYTIEYPENSITSVKIPNAAFFQINSRFVSVWLSKIEDFINETFSTNEEKIKILEIFSGFKFITEMISFNRPVSSLGIDILKEEELKKTTISNNKFKSQKIISGEEYIQCDLTRLDKLAEEKKEIIKNYDFDLMLINPPRAGFMPSEMQIFFDEIIRPVKKPVIYSSCNAATFARDAAKLSEFGYKIKKLMLLDFFPWTPHYELLALLEC
ncbi:MAG: hypothetical protein OEZ13_01740 [Spirochaetia bacterium]|nr:hypothetical protein [Spirochaetia bacterium]